MTMHHIVVCDTCQKVAGLDWVCIDDKERLLPPLRWHTDLRGDFCCRVCSESYSAPSTDPERFAGSGTS